MAITTNLSYPAKLRQVEETNFLSSVVIFHYNECSWKKWTTNGVSSISGHFSFVRFIACARELRRARDHVWERRMEREEREREEEEEKGKQGEKRKGTEKIPRAVGRPRGCRPHCPRHGHVPNNSLGTRKQLLRNSCYRATLRVYMSCCPSARRAFHVTLWALNLSIRACPARESFLAGLIPLGGGARILFHGFHQRSEQACNMVQGSSTRILEICKWRDSICKHLFRDKRTEIKQIR